MTSEDEEHEFVGVNSVLFILVCLICIYMGQALAKKQITWLSESAAHMLFGLICGGIIALFGERETNAVLFNSDIFFFLLLPPIIFESGFSLSKKHFFRNFGTIILFAVLGTLVSSFIIGLSLFGFAKAGAVPLDSHDPLEALLFGTLISAVDPVGTLATLGKETLQVDPTLYSLIFGESVLNDAVSIVLYKTLQGFTDRDVVLSFEHHFFEIVGIFIGVFLGSLLVGAAVALLCAFLLKNSDLGHQDIYVEFAIILLFSYGSYSMGEVLELSGIVSVFSCGIVMNHYAVHNVTKVCHMSVHSVIKAIAYISECFLYAYLGITAGISFEKEHESSEWSFNLIILTLLLCFFSRAMNIFPFSALANLRRNTPIPLNMQVMMWFAGIRGAIAFALALNVRTNHRHVVITSTLSIVFFTTVICGGFTEKLLGMLALKNSPQESPQAEMNRSVLMEQSDAAVVIREYSTIHRLWRDFDLKYLSQWFGGEKSRVRSRPGGLVFGNNYVRQEDEVGNNGGEVVQDVELFG